MTPNSFVFNDTYVSPSPSRSPYRSGKEKFLKVILGIIALILIFDAIWFCLIKTSMPLVSVEINGIPGVERNFILSSAGITNETSFFSVSTSEMENALEKLYMVDTAKVSKQFPDKIYIKLNPRIPVVITLASLNGKSTPLFIDKHGVVCKIGIADSESKMQASILPIVSGLNFDDVTLGTRLPISFRRMLESVERINNSNPVLLSLISEMQIQEKLFDGFELILYPVNSNVKVRIGSELNEDTLKYMMLTIDALKKTGVEVDEIDFRTGTASYQVKETFNG
jgi:cell division protein FtsQ